MVKGTGNKRVLHGSGTEADQQVALRDMFLTAPLASPARQID
jgi:hypothetical protein